MQTEYVSLPALKTVVRTTVFCFLLSAATAQEAPASRLNPTNVLDVEHPESLISAANWLRGLYLQSAPTGPRPSLYGTIPEDWRGKPVCVRAVTIDGRYEFVADYLVPSDMPDGDTELVYATAFGQAWSAATTENSGVALSAGSCNDGEPDTAALVPVRWNGGLAVADATGDYTLIVNLHARAAQEVVATAILEADSRPLPVSCAKLDRSDAAQFNFTCRITLDPTDEGGVTFSHVRLNGGRSSDPRTATFILAGAM